MRPAVLCFLSVSGGAGVRGGDRRDGQWMGVRTGLALGRDRGGGSAAGEGQLGWAWAGTVGGKRAAL